MTRCRCRHEDCSAEFDHHGHADETTCCPECGRQQRPDPIPLWDDSLAPTDERTMYDPPRDPELRRRGGWGGW